MKFNILGVILVSLATVFITGCPREEAVYAVESAPVTVGSASMDDVKRAITRAGGALGWVMKEREPGLIVGTLNVRTHMAQVEIPYSRDSYSILYKDSSNLNFTGSTIHSRYNVWVQNLDRRIQVELSLL